MSLTVFLASDYLCATFTNPRCSWDLYFIWQKQQTSKGQAETGVSSCSCILLVLWSYYKPSQR